MLPDFDKQFYIVSDACDHALGGMLAQDYDGHLRPVAYHSRKFTSAEKNYTVREQECLAIVDCLRKFEHYLPQNLQGRVLETRALTSSS